MTALTLFFAGVIVLAIVMYVLMDGFDLGIGILFPAAADEDQRDVMMNTVAPVWDGNETWLVLGGSVLFGAFPLAYAILLPALYIPLTVMLLALIFRGVAFEFRHRSGEGRAFWGRAFLSGSTIATFAQGAILGAFIQGFPVVDRAFVGGPFHWLTPFSVATGFALVGGYALLGATWLAMRTEGDLQERAFRWAERAFPVVLGFIVLVSVWTPFLHPEIRERWFSWPNLVLLSPVPVLTGGVALAAFWAIRRRAETLPFLLALTLFLLSFLGLGISLWPNVVPPSIGLGEAAAAETSQAFLFAGVAFLLPLVLGYTAYVYWVFRGKVREGYD
ncbi:MAG: cytochrome d ubiquinol oxidase subunit II [Geminicoccaceae bacterium]|nr:cytochrome d ubiquinol oxidase subunit II [Geminicoccaceae bacterium]